MSTTTRRGRSLGHNRRRCAPRRPSRRIVVPDRPESWSAEEVESLLWPDTPDHLPLRNLEDGWPELLGRF